MSIDIQMTKDEKKALIKQIILERLRNNTLIETLVLNSRPMSHGWEKWGKYVWMLRDNNREAREEIEKKTYEAIDLLEVFLDSTDLIDRVLKEKDAVPTRSKKPLRSSR